MVARSRMGGPWSRAQRVARAFQDGGHEVTLAWGDDGNCADPIAPTLEIPVPSPLGLPDAIARHTFPLASRLGLMGRKPVHSFEEVLWLTGALDERYTRAAVDTLGAHMRTARPDVVFSEFSLAAVIAARAEGIPCVGSGSQPTTAAYASSPRKSAGIRRLLHDMGMPAPASSLTQRLLAWVREFIQFGMVGATAYVVDAGLFNLLQHGPLGILAGHPNTAQFVAAATATLYSWIANRLWTYRGRNRDNATREAILFFFANACGIGISQFCLLFTHHILGFTSALADNIAVYVVGFALGTAFRFFFYHYVVFTGHTRA